MDLYYTIVIAFKQNQLLKFGSAGLLNTGVDWTLFFLITQILHKGELLAKIYGAVGGVTSAFILSTVWVFSESFSNYLKHTNGLAAKLWIILKKYLQTIASYAAGMLINIGVFLSILQFGAPELVSLLLATCCSFTFNFTLSKKFVFKNNYKSNGDMKHHKSIR